MGRLELIADIARRAPIPGIAEGPHFASHPEWSLPGDFEMIRYMLRGRDAELTEIAQTFLPRHGPYRRGTAAVPEPAAASAGDRDAGAGHRSDDSAVANLINHAEPPWSSRTARPRAEAAHHPAGTSNTAATVTGQNG